MGLPVSVGRIAQALGGRVEGNANLTIAGLASLESATPADFAFLSHAKYQNQLRRTQAGCVVLRADLEDAARVALLGRAYVVAADPYLYFAQLTQWWRREVLQDLPAPGVHPTAWVDPSAQVHPTATVGPHAVIEALARIGAHTQVGPRVTVGRRCVVGERCMLHSGVVIGADGFGFAKRPDGGWEKIEQLGAVRIGNDVEIGANSCVDRGALSDTVLEDGVKLDNLVQIGHNVRVGAHTAMAGCAGVAGSAVIGQRCTVGGGAVVLGHLELADDVHISAASVVTKSILKAGTYRGLFPIDDNAAWEKNAASLKQLASLRERIKALEAAAKA